MTLQSIKRPIVTTIMNDQNIFTSLNSGIMKQVKKELAIAFDKVDMESLVF